MGAGFVCFAQKFWHRILQHQVQTLRKTTMCIALVPQTAYKLQLAGAFAVSRLGVVCGFDVSFSRSLRERILVLGLCEALKEVGLWRNTKREGGSRQESKECSVVGYCTRLAVCCVRTPPRYCRRLFWTKSRPTMTTTVGCNTGSLNCARIMYMYLVFIASRECAHCVKSLPRAVIAGQTSVYRQTRQSGLMEVRVRRVIAVT